MIFNQKEVSKTNNIIMHMFRTENILDIEDNVLWKNPHHASSSSCRPVMLLCGKETSENCSIVSELQLERKDKQFVIEAYGRQITVNVKAQLSMVDGKFHSLLS